MAADVIQFVSAIDANPTVRLDINDETTWRCRSFLAPPPRLRRSMSQNVMTDGGYVSSSQYGTRTLYIDLDLISTTQDTNAAQLQKLARELDREKNIIRYQPEGASRPVFFKVWRSDFSSLVDMKAALAFRQLSIEIVAEPFAYGIRETISVGTVNNDPAAGSNGCYFDISSGQVLGDVPAPMVLVATGAPVDAGRSTGMFLGVKSWDTPSDLQLFHQAEAMTISSGSTTADALMSGAGSNCVEFNPGGTATFTGLTKAALSTVAQTKATRGTYRLVAVLRRITSSGTWKIGAQGASSLSTVSTSTNRQRVDLGVVAVGDNAVTAAGAAAPLLGSRFSAGSDLARTSGTAGVDNLRVDYLELLPADQCVLTATLPTGGTLNGLVVDSYNETVYKVDTASGVFDGTASVLALATVTGGFPSVYPVQSTRYSLSWVLTDGTTASITKTDTSSVTVHYWPLYLHVRPVSS